MADSIIKRVVVPAILVLSSCVVAYLLIEGALAVARGRSPGTSIGYAAYAWMVEQARARDNVVPGDPNTLTLRDKSELETLMAKFEKDGVGLGNTPYKQLKTEEASIHVEVDGCKRQKPNLRKRQAHLLTRLFDPMDPIMAFWDDGRTLDPQLAEFIERYSFHQALLTTNEFGDRTTVPSVDSDRKVIVAGDSVANGVLLNDGETIASRLQGLDTERQYINTGINGASAADVICAVEAAARNYGGTIEELIYIYTENDFDPSAPYGSPEEVFSWMRPFVETHNIPKVTVVSTRYFYNIIPQLTRFKGYRGYLFSSYADERARLENEVKAAGFRFIDFADIALEENRKAGTMFAAFALFVDAAHYSRLGTARLVERLRAN